MPEKNSRKVQDSRIRFKHSIALLGNVSPSCFALICATARTRSQHVLVLGIVIDGRRKRSGSCSSKICAHWCATLVTEANVGSLGKELPDRRSSWSVSVRCAWVRMRGGIAGFPKTDPCTEQRKGARCIGYRQLGNGVRVRIIPEGTISVLLRSAFQDCWP